MIVGTTIVIVESTQRIGKAGRAGCSESVTTVPTTQTNDVNIKKYGFTG